MIRHRPISLTGYGGMPSAHSALFSSLVTVAWLYEGVTSFAFTLSVILYLMVVRDAIGVRQHLGTHSSILERLLREHAKDHAHDIPHEKIVTRLGHTPLEAIVGTIFGVVLTLILAWFIQ